MIKPTRTGIFISIPVAKLKLLDIAAKHSNLKRAAYARAAVLNAAENKLSFKEIKTTKIVATKQ